MAESKEGKVAKVIFRNDTNGYTVASFETEDEEFTITGSFHALDEGAQYRITGEFKTHPKYGEQFNVVKYEELLPDDSDGIRAFLASGAIQGIGPKTANLIVDKFGESSLDVIENDPEKLLQVKGIGKKSLKKIVGSFNERREFTKISFALREYGITTAQSVRIYAGYGSESVKVVEENPYALVEDIYGISFRNADAIAEKVGIEKDSEFRIDCGIKYVLQTYAGSGSTYVPKDELVEKAVTLLDVGSGQIEDALVRMAFAGEIQTDTIDSVSVVYLYDYYQSEQRVAWDLKRLKEAHIDPLPLLDINDMIRAVDSSIELSDEQRRAVQDALTNNICIITGGPGTGKTTIINFIVRILQHLDVKTAIAAPTGRAAKRIVETSGFAAKTIHRMLGYTYTEDEEMQFSKNEEEPLDAEAVIIDEASMVDLKLMEGLLRALKDGTRLIIVGDADQLPSVGAGNVLRDMIKSEYIHTIKLKEIFRQAGESLIVVNAHRINAGEYPDSNERDKDFFIMHRRTDEEILSQILELMAGRLENYYDFINSWRDIQVLTPTKKGPLGTVSLNNELQQALNPHREGVREKKFGSKTFREGDKVMQITNNYEMEWRERGFAAGEGYAGFNDPDSGLGYEGSITSGQGVFNGDMGTIEHIDPEMGRVTVNFDDKIVTYDADTLDELELAYAVTVHKSQGSEFPAVIMPMTWFPPMLMTRNLLYTAVTRGKKLVVIVGHEDRMQAMIDNDRIDERYTGLWYRLKEIDFGLGL